MSRHVIVGLTLLLPLACTNETLIVQPPESTTRIDSVVPGQAAPGKSIAIYGYNFSSLRWPYPVSFNGATVGLEEFSDSVLIARVPWDGSTGPLMVLTETDSAVGPVFTVVPSCGLDACVEPYYDPLLTEQGSWSLDCNFRYVKWSGEIRSDTVVLTKAFCFGDDSGRELTLRIWKSPPYDGRTDGLFVSHEIQGTSTFTLKGVVFLQSFDRNGVVCGKVVWWVGPATRLWRDFVFWYDFGK